MLDAKLYEVLKPFGNYKAGQILNAEKPEEKKIIKRKIVETGTICPVMEKENKMSSKKYENKGGAE